MKLQYLEYLSLINKIKGNANIHFRGGKEIELLQGFETQTGAVFEAEVRDYSCFGTPGKPGHGSEEYWYSKILENGVWIPTTYYTNYPDDTEPTTGSGEAPVAENDGLSLEQYYSLQNTPVFRQAVESAIELILTSGDSLAEAQVAKWYEQDSVFHAQGLTNGVFSSYPTVKRRVALQLRVDEAKASISSTNCRLFPNPTTGNFTLNFASLDRYYIEVFDVLGQSVLNKTVTGVSAEFSLAGFAAGSYTVTVRASNFSETLKLVLLPE